MGSIKNRSKLRGEGFTIIEVLIVLAIGGLILLIVFLAVPAAQRNGRNLGRKHTTDLILSQLQQYQTDAGSLPASQAIGDAFLSNYIPNLGVGYTVKFRDNGAPHSDRPDYDEIFVQYGHWCTNAHGGADSPGDPIATGPGGDANNRYQVLWTKLEPSVIYCIDNG